MKYGYKTFTSKLADMDFKMKAVIIILCMAVIRIGSVIPLPFVNQEYMKAFMSMEGLGFLNAITGGSMQQMSIFALSVSPHITASIIIQLLSVAIPSLETLRKDGKTGMDKYKNIMRSTGMGLAVLQAGAMAIGLGKQGLFTNYNVGTVLLATAIWSMGAAGIILISELIDKFNVGSGLSMILFCNIMSSIPSDMKVLKEVVLHNSIPAVMAVKICIMLSIFIAAVTGCVVIADSAKKIRVSQTRKMTGSADSTFPIPLATCSVMPIIFAGSIMSMPILISQFVPAMQTGVWGRIIGCLNTSRWFLPDQPFYTVGIVLYVGMTTFFTYFYLSIGFNAREISENLKTQGTVIPGIRPGKPTSDYIEKISTKVALLGNFLMTGMILLMHLVCNASGVGTLSIAGTSLFICVNVVAEESKLLKTYSALRRRTVRGFLTGGKREIPYSRRSAI